MVNVVSTDEILKINLEKVLRGLEIVIKMKIKIKINRMRFKEFAERGEIIKLLKLFQRRKF